MTKLSPRLTLTLILTLLTSLIQSQLVKAQITPDNSLGAENSTVRQDNINNLPSDVIEGGASRGSNLFHSFQEFNINEGRGAYFANPAVIQNIFSRVTGGNTSNILGTLGVLGNANLYLINPNGIMFGPNARLDMRGAFVGSTADSLLFNNNYEFSASNPTAPPLLTVDIPLGLRFRQQAGDISSSANLSTPNNLTLQGGNLNLTGSVIAGGDLTLEAQNNLTIRDTIENPFIAVSGQDLLIQGNNIDIFTLNNPKSAIASYGNLTLKSPNPVIGDAHYWSGGSFRIEQFDGSLGDLYSPNDPIIQTLGNVEFAGYQGASLHIIAGGSVTIGTIVITGSDSSENTINPVNTPNLANVTLSDGTTVVIDGTEKATLDIRAGVNPDIITGEFLTGSIFLLDEFDFGQSGNFIINPASLSPELLDSAITIGDIVIFSNGGQILLTNQYQPNLNLEAGDITLKGLRSIGIDATGIGGNGSDVIFDARGGIIVNKNIDASSDMGNGGNVKLLAQGNITLNDGASITTDGVLSGNIDLNSNEDIFLYRGNITSNIIKTANNLNSEATGGNIQINARSLHLKERSIQSNTLGIGHAGGINIRTTEGINLKGSILSSNVVSEAKGNSGEIVINTSTLTLEDSRISTSSFSKGNAGLIDITATKGISLTEESTSGIINSGIDSFIWPFAEGKSEGIIINTSTLTLDNSANILTTTSGSGDAGAIRIKATEGISIDGNRENGLGSFISSGVVSFGLIDGVIQKGNGGEIIIDTSTLILKNGAFIITSTNGLGDAGAINITATEGISLTGKDIFGSPTKIDSSSSGTDADGNSGGIIINTSTLTLENGGVISSSTFGVGNAGNITINVKGDATLTSSFIQSNVESGGQGNGGNIDFIANLISLNDGSRITSGVQGSLLPNGTIVTPGEGNGGNITLKAHDITFSGFSEQLGQSSAILSSVGKDAKGIAGDIKIEADNSFSLKDFGFIRSTLDSNATGKGGNIEIKAGSLSFNNAVLATSTFGKGEVNSNDLTGNAGNITINVERNATLVDSGILSDVQSGGKGNAGNIDFTADSLSLNGINSISSGIRGSRTPSGAIVTPGQGNGGNITIKARDINLSGLSEAPQGFRFGISSSVGQDARGIGGNIKIEADNSLTLSNFVLIDTILENDAIGRAGDIEIKAGLLSLDNNSAISTISLGKGEANDNELTGNAGNIIIDVQGSATFVNSGIESNIGAGGIGNAGNIDFIADSISLLDGSSIAAVVNGELLLPNGTIIAPGQGNGGSITIKANAINIDGFSPQASSQINTSVGIKTTGDAGNINIESKTLNLGNGAFISAITEGEGDAGAVNITATESILLTGESSRGFVSSIQSVVFETGEGNSGGITINTANLTLENGGEISASTFGKGDAGAVNIINAQNVFLDNSGITSAVGDTGVGNSGGITVETNILTLTNGAFVNASTLGMGKAGTIEIEASELASLSGTIFDDFLNREVGGIFAFTLGEKEAGNININTPQLTISEGAGIEAFTQGEGTAGNITINAPDSIILNSDTKLIVETSDAGTAGNININTPLLTIGENAQLSATATATSTAPTAGNINLNVNQLNISGELGIFAETNSTPTAGSLTIQPYQNDRQDAHPTLNIQFTEKGFISARTTSIGDGGSITLTAPENIDISGLGSITAETSGEGNAGNINITTENLTIRDGIEIRANTSSVGDSGNIILSILNLNLDNATIEALTTNQGNPGSILISNGENQANQVNIANNSTISTEIRGEGNPETAQPANITINSENLSLTSSQITASTNSNRDAGEITVTADNLTLTNQSNIETNTSSSGDAGDIVINLQDNLIINKSAIAASTSSNSIGKGGDIIINSPVINIEDKASITVNSQGKGDGGNIFLTSQNLTLNNESTISATTASGEGGNINLNVSDILRQRNNSPISATAGGTGNGGNISINTKYLIGSQNSGITANAFEGNGGNINITAKGIFRDLSSPITASSQLGVDGVVETNTPEVDPSRGLINLPQDIVDPNALIAQNVCRKGNQSEFTVRGKGGLPISPETTSSSNEVEVTLVEGTQELSITESKSNQTVTSKEREIIPAQGWVKNEKGDLVLVAYTNENSVNRNVNSPVTCPSN